MSKMPVTEFLEKLQKAVDSNTVYATGGYGACSNFSENKTKYANRTPFNASDIKNAPNDTYYFDCVCLIKGILWGWDANPDLKYGGANYASNGVGDYSISKINNMCATYTSDFTNIQAGEWVNIGTEHCGIYIGGGQVIESTPIWKDGVQITFVQNMGYHTAASRRWDGHGKLPWVEYPLPLSKPVEEDGVWGKCTTYYLQIMLGTESDGEISNQPYRNKKYNVNCSTAAWKYTFAPKKGNGSDVIEQLQRRINSDPDGWCGTKTITRLQEYLRNNGYYHDKIDGYMGYYTVLALQQWINKYYYYLAKN